MKHLLIILVLAAAPAVYAQNARSWVASFGSDSNPCTRTAPCATFGGALAKTNAAGEINCADAGDFGPIFAINKALTIDCAGTAGRISDTIVIAANASSDTVTIRNVAVNGISSLSGIGVFHQSAKAVHLEKISITGVVDGCVDVEVGAPTLLTVDDTSLSGCGFVGISAFTSNAGPVVVNVNHVRAVDASRGILGGNGSRMTIRDSTIYFNQLGISQVANAMTNLGSTVAVINSTLGFSSTAALQSLPGEFMLTFGNTFVNDVLALGPNGGMIFTGGDNNNSGSAQGTANGGTVAKF